VGLAALFCAFREIHRSLRLHLRMNCLLLKRFKLPLHFFLRIYFLLASFDTLMRICGFEFLKEKHDFGFR
jgi:hypothetical protein